jgi:hypothetical protein
VVTTSLRIGCGSAYAEDRLDLAVALLEAVDLDYMAFDCLAERTLAMAQLRRMADPSAGYDLRLPEFVTDVLPAAVSRGVGLVANLGAANPMGAAEYIRSHAGNAGRFTLGVVEGDDVRSLVEAEDPVLWETGERLSRIRGSVVSANAYLGADPILDALGQGADVVIGGRIADPSLFVAPVAFRLGIEPDDWHRLGEATLVGHALECGTHLTGGNFADPPYRVVPSFRRPSMPYADVTLSEGTVLRKIDDSDGLLSVNTCKAQLAYELGDPSAYLTPDVAADFSQVTATWEQKGVRIRGASGRVRPADLKVLVGVSDGFIGEGQVSFAGPGALSRATLGRQILEEWIGDYVHRGEILEQRADLLGVDALHGSRSPSPSAGCAPYEVHLRLAARTTSERAARFVSHCVEYLQVFGPAATGGHRKSVRPSLSLYSCTLPRAAIDPRVTMMAIGSEAHE